LNPFHGQPRRESWRIRRDERREHRQQRALQFTRQTTKLAKNRASHSSVGTISSELSPGTSSCAVL